MMMLFKEIPIWETFAVVREITEGMSGERKYYIESKDNKKYLLRVADVSNYETKKKDYDLLLQLNKANLPVPLVIDFGKCEDGKSVYTLLSWVEGNDAEKIVPGLSEEKQYAIGYESGRILRQIHLNAPLNAVKEDWYDRYFEVIIPRIGAYQNEGIPFEGAKEIIDFINDNKELLHNRPQCRLHGDYHLGNLIINEKEELSVIDWHTVDFEDGGDPWYDFTRIGIDYPAYTSGQLDGYFDNNIPENFWRMLAIYLSASAITSIVWAKYFAPEELDGIMKLNHNVVKWYDKMKSVVPTWYREYKNL